VGGRPASGAPRGLTRRHAVIAAAAGVAASLAPGRPAWGAGRLHARRAATYRRLVRLLRDAPDGRFANRPAAATRTFAAWYARQDATTRAHADAVLDALGRRSHTSYADLAVAAPRGAGPFDAVVAAAVGLAAIACDPPLAEDERPLTPPLWRVP
jgi:hypothetical protein